MANWSRNTLKLSGAGANDIVAFGNANMQPVEDWPGTKWLDLRPLLGESCPVENTVLFVHDGGLPLTCVDNCSTFFTETKWQPPIEAFALFTQKYATLTVTIAWSVESEYIPRAVRIFNGTVTLTRDGDFILAEAGEPIHHWLVDVTPEAMDAIKADDEKRQAAVAARAEENCRRLRENIDSEVPRPIAAEAEPVKVLMPSADWLHEREGFREFSQFRVRDSQIGKIRDIPGVTCSPYTLDEKTFLVGIDPDNYPTGLNWGEAAPWLALIERRGITLTPEEVETVRQKTMAELEQYRAKLEKREQGGAEEPGPWPMISQHEIERYSFHPTAREIALLLPLSTPERRNELQAARDSPQWTTEWREWEEYGLGEVLKEEGPAKPQEPIQAREFLDMLNAMKK